MKNYKTTRLLIVGPLPPPLDGTSVSFQLFCEEIKHQAEIQSIEIIDSSLKQLQDGSHIISTTGFRRAIRILKSFGRQVMATDQVLIFGSTGFLLSMAPLLLSLAKIARKPCYIRAFGGSLDRYYSNLRPLFRWILLWTLRHADGLIVQTELLHNFFSTLIGDKVHLVPGYRSLPIAENVPPNSVEGSTKGLRLVFLGHVREEKGVLVLLESLRNLGLNTNETIHCDIFGPIYESFTERFDDELAQTQNVTYKGVLSPEEVISTLRHYDALVFPSYYPGEGHPGVLIEAMMAGIPVITTAFRSIPELVEDRVNGLLVTPQDSKILSRAIKTILNDRQLLMRMASKNGERRRRYDARQVVPLILQPLGVKLPSSSPSLTTEHTIKS